MLNKSLKIPTFAEILQISRSRGRSSEDPNLWNGLVGAWPLQEGGGITAWDVSGFGNNGTLTNMETTDWTISNPGQCLDFGGTNEFINCGDVLALANVPMSVSFWHRAAGDYATNQAVCAYAQAGSSAAFVVTFAYTNGKYEWWQGGGSPLLASTITVADDLWRRIVMTRSGTAGDWTLRCYVDGILDKETTTVTNSQISSGGSFAIGRFGGFSGYYLIGSLADVRIHARVLTDAEIACDDYANPWAMYRQRRKVFRSAAVSETPTPPVSTPLQSPYIMTIAWKNRLLGSNILSSDWRGILYKGSVYAISWLEQLINVSPHVASWLASMTNTDLGIVSWLSNIVPSNVFAVSWLGTALITIIAQRQFDIDWMLNIINNNNGVQDWINNLNPTQINNMSWLTDVLSNNRKTTDWLGSLDNNYPYVISWLGNLIDNEILDLSWLGEEALPLSVDQQFSLDYLGNTSSLGVEVLSWFNQLAITQPATISWLNNISRENTQVLDWLFSLTKSNPSVVSWLQKIISEPIINVSYGGTAASIIANQVFNLDVVTRYSVGDSFWVLQTRNKTWTLTLRGTTWTLAAHPTTWTLLR